MYQRILTQFSCNKPSASNSVFKLWAAFTCSEQEVRRRRQPECVRPASAALCQTTAHCICFLNSMGAGQQHQMLCCWKLENTFVLCCSALGVLSHMSLMCLSGCWINTDNASLSCISVLENCITALHHAEGGKKNTNMCENEKKKNKKNKKLQRTTKPNQDQDESELWKRSQWCWGNGNQFVQSRTNTLHSYQIKGHSEFAILHLRDNDHSQKHFSFLF